MAEQFAPEIKVRLAGLVPEGAVTEVFLADGQTIARVGNDLVAVSTAASPIKSKTITIKNPTSSEDLSMFFTNGDITISEIRAVLKGSSTPSVTWTLRHATSRSATGSEVVTGGTVTTSTTTGSDVTSLDDPTVIADSFLWLETTAKGGTVDEIHITVFYTDD